MYVCMRVTRVARYLRAVCVCLAVTTVVVALLFLYAHVKEDKGCTMSDTHPPSLPLPPSPPPLCAAILVILNFLRSDKNKNPFRLEKVFTRCGILSCFFVFGGKILVPLDYCTVLLLLSQ